MRIPADEARRFWDHRTQRRMGLDPAKLVDEGMIYLAAETLCLAFHRAPWPRVWMVHVGAEPEAWGNTVPQAAGLLADFWAEGDADRVVAWIEESNRPACALARRCGFIEDGRFPGVVMFGLEL